MDLTDDKVTDMARAIVLDAKRQISNVSCSCGWPNNDGLCAKREHGVESRETPCKMDMVRETQEEAASA